MEFIRIIVIIFFIMGIGIYGQSSIVEKTSGDSTYPQIASDREVLEITCNYNDEDLLTGLKAYDQKDGDISDDILVGGISRFVTAGTSEVTYVVFDSNHNSTTFNRKVVFSDYRSPQISLSQPLVFTAGNGGDALSYIGANDLLDGDVSNLVTLQESNIIYQLVGDYSISVSITNSFGDYVDVTLPVHVIEENNQSIDIELSENIVYLNQGASFDPASYIYQVQDNNGNELAKRNVQYQSNVNTSVPGVYEVEYNISSNTGQGTTYLTVIVNEQRW